MSYFYVPTLLSTPYQMRLYNHRPFGYFTATIGHSGVQKAVLGDPDFILRQHVKNGGDRTKIEVLFLVDQVYMDYFCHSVFRIFFVANILNSSYME